MTFHISCVHPSLDPTTRGRMITKKKKRKGASVALFSSLLCVFNDCSVFACSRVRVCARTFLFPTHSALFCTFISRLSTTSLVQHLSLSQSLSLCYSDLYSRRLLGVQGPARMSSLDVYYAVLFYPPPSYLYLLSLIFRKKEGKKGDRETPSGPSVRWAMDVMSEGQWTGKGWRKEKGGGRKREGRRGEVKSGARRKEEEGERRK